MQQYAVTQGLVACLFSAVWLGGCNHCACQEETRTVCTCSVAPAACGGASVPAGVRQVPAALAATPVPRSLPLPTPLRIADGPGPSSQAAPPPRAEISFQADDPPRPAYLPPAPVKPPTPEERGTPPKESRYGHAPDYTWLRGQVEYLHGRKEWRLRYTSLGEVDPHGGRVILIENGHVAYLADGQFVRVEGHLVPTEDPRGSAACYRIEAFKVLEQPSPN